MRESQDVARPAAAVGAGGIDRAPGAVRGQSGDADARGERRGRRRRPRPRPRRARCVRRSRVEADRLVVDQRAAQRERPAQVAARLEAMNDDGLAPITAVGRPVSARGAVRPRGPVERVLEGARDAEVVLRRRDQEGVGVGDRARAARRRPRRDRPRGPRCRRASRRARPRSRSRRRPGACSCARRRSCVLCEPAGAAGDRQDAGGHDAAFTASTSSTSRTFSPTVSAPFGSGAFQEMPNSVRSMTAEPDRPRRSLPYGSAPAPVICASISIGRVTPRSSSSPRDAQLAVAEVLDLRWSGSALRVVGGVEEVGRLQVAGQRAVDRCGRSRCRSCPRWR